MQDGETDDVLGDSRFFDPARFQYAQHLQPEEVILKIEVIVKDFLLQTLSYNSNEIGFQLANAIPTNAVLLRNEIHLGLAQKFSQLFHGHTAQSYSRIWRVLSFVHSLLKSGKQATQREAYYCMIDAFNNQDTLDRTILNVSSLLQCTRRSLGLMAGSKGEMAGIVQIQNKPGDKWLDCSRVPLQISGEMSPLIRVSSQARFILVIEKDGIFQRLVEDRIYNQIPCILICGKGYPDIGTRAMLRHMQDKLQLPVLGIVDYNVDGLAILLTYKLGSVRMGLESFQYATDVKWLALRGESIQQLDLPKQGFQDLTKRDRAKIDSMLESPFIKRNPEYENELQYMKHLGKKAELQVLFHLGRDGITKFISKMMLNRQWI